jgi:hypothetical protein
VASSITERIKQFIQDLATDPVEERVAEYVIREVHNGRRLMEVVEDSYVKNRLNQDKVQAILENPEVIDALEAEIHSSMTTPDTGFLH